MKPLNSAQRRRSFFKFLGFYALALAAIVLPLFSFKLLDFQSAENKCQNERDQLLEVLKQMNSDLDTLFNNLDSKYVGSKDDGDRGKLQKNGDNLLKELDEIIAQFPPKAELSQAAVYPLDVVKRYRDLLLRIADGSGKPQPPSVCETELTLLKSEIRKLKTDIKQRLLNLEAIPFKDKKIKDDEEIRRVKVEVEGIRNVLEGI